LEILENFLLLIFYSSALLNLFLH